MAANVGQARLGQKRKRSAIEDVKRAFTGLRRGETIAGYLFLAPNFIGFVIFMLFPICFAFYIMLTDWSLAKEPQFIGLKNFDTMVNDRIFWKSLGNSFYYTFVAVPTGIFIAFWLALALNRKMRGIIFFRTVYFLPQITLTVAAATIWRWIYQPEIGMINHILELIGIDGPKWIHDTKWAMPSVIIMSNWQGIGFAMLILLAGLQGIPEEFYEAAAIDGASGWQRMRFVTLPMLSPALFFVVVTSLIGAFQSFDQFYVLTQGGPAHATTPLTLYIFQNAFSFFKMGYGAALAAVLFVIILIITIIQWQLAQRWVFGFEEDD
ncbi:MAG: sugar ABC transporter permease [Chloroflexi bacterium]|nr:sugar ABC transporter permease [Chloroflexota bacterium]